MLGRSSVRRQRRPRAVLGSLAGLLVLYLTLPLVAFAVRFTTTSRRGFHVAGLFPALWVSLSCATIALAIMTTLGVPLAYLLARSRGRVAAALGVVVQIPLALPPLMSGIILIYLVGPYTYLGRLFHGALTNSSVGVVIAMTFVASPFLIVAARAGFASIDAGLLDVAGTLGHGEFSQFLRVGVPQAASNIRAGMLLAWLRAFGEFGAVVVLAYNPTSLPIHAYNQFSGVGLPTTLAPTALAVLVAVAAVVLSRLRWRPRQSAEAPSSASRPVTTLAAEPIGFDVNERFGDFHLQISQAEPVSHLAVLGASGSGKSALLRCLAGVDGTSGTELFSGSESLHKTSPQHRRVGYVAQGFALFSHLTVWQNLMFGTRATPQAAAYWLQRLHLDGLENRRSNELSGGQRQRVALGQALCNDPRVLLLDEPFSALDFPVRLELRRELRQLQREMAISTVLVTHDPLEAAYLSDQMMVLVDGRVVQSGSARSIFDRPNTPDVAKLLGVTNMSEGVIGATGIVENGALNIQANTASFVRGERVAWSIAPETVAVQPRGTHDHDTDVEPVQILSGTVLDVVDAGVSHECLVALSSTLTLCARRTTAFEVVAGQACEVVLPTSQLTLWPLALEGQVPQTPRV